MRGSAVAQTACVPPRDRFTVVLILVVYVLPLTLVSVLLTLAGLLYLALALRSGATAAAGTTVGGVSNIAAANLTDVLNNVTGMQS